jgi:hypothetical protein
MVLPGRVQPGRPLLTFRFPGKRSRLCKLGSHATVKRMLMDLPRARSPHPLADPAGISETWKSLFSLALSNHLLFLVKRFIASLAINKSHRRSRRACLMRDGEIKSEVPHPRIVYGTPPSWSFLSVVSPRSHESAGCSIYCPHQRHT